MLKQIRIRPLAAAAIALFLGASGLLPCFAGQSPDELLKKKYEKILGKYDLTFEGQTTILDFSIREGKLWADSGDGRPAIMTPVADSTEEFSCDDPETGRFTFKFLKDDKGEYTQCRVVAVDIGLDAVAEKIKPPNE